MSSIQACRFSLARARLSSWRSSCKHLANRRWRCWNAVRGRTSSSSLVRTTHSRSLGSRMASSDYRVVDLLKRSLAIKVTRSLTSSANASIGTQSRESLLSRLYSTLGSLRAFQKWSGSTISVCLASRFSLSHLRRHSCQVLSANQP